VQNTYRKKVKYNLFQKIKVLAVSCFHPEIQPSATPPLQVRICKKHNATRQKYEAIRQKYNKEIFRKLIQPNLVDSNNKFTGRYIKKSLSSSKQ